MFNLSFKDYNKYPFIFFVHAAEFGAVILIRISLIFLLIKSFLLNDSSSYAISAIFAITMDSAGILGAYIANSLLTARLSWFIGFSLHIAGCIACIFSLGSNIDIFYLGLASISIGIGIMKCNSLVISNDYIKIEVKPKFQNDYNTIMYLTMILASFSAVFSSGIIMRSLDHRMIFVFSIIVFLITSFVFLAIEWKNIKKEITERYKNPKLFSHVKKIKLILSVGSTIGILFICYNFNKSLLVKHFPLIVFGGFYFYLAYLAWKNIYERKYILFAMLYSSVLTFYISLEKQIENILGLFVKRNLDRTFFGFEIPTLNINSFFQFSIVAISLLFFKKKLQSKVADKYVIFIMLFFSIACFSIFFLGTKMHDELFNVKLKYYYLGLVVLAIGDIFVYSKLMSVCRIMPINIRNIMSSFMMMNVSFGFYLCRVYADLAAVNSNVDDKAFTLSVYQDHFLRMIILGAIFSAIMFIFYQIKGKKILELNE
jgi:POT family proton-dependent oligopeptide transporter